MSAEKLANEIGYSEEDLAALPEGANLGLSCGNPGLIARLQPGEVVVDLGSGAGFDAFLCGPKVGTEGRVIGVDMTHEMLAKARANLVGYTERTGLANIEFRLGEIEHLPLADNSVDVIMSNCVINLSIDKQQVWREIARVLKPGGRVAVSDIALFKPLPDQVRANIEGWIGCVSGAVLVDDYLAHMEAVGLSQIAVIPKKDYVETLTSEDDPFYQQIRAGLPEGAGPSDYVTSINASAVKPAPCCSGTSCC
jgi:arsenite methyltransferase